MVTEPNPTHAGAARGFRQYARVAAMLMVATGLLVLFGWALDIRMLTALWPGAASMNASTAIAFVLSATALLAFLRDKPGPGLLCGGLSALVLVGASWTLLAYAVGAVSKLDQLFPDAAAVVAGVPAGRMSELTAIGFVLLALLGIQSCKGASRAAQWRIDALAIALLAIAMTGLAAFGFQLGDAGRAGMPFNPVAIHTSLMFLLAALAWMSARPNRGMTRIATADSFGGALARRLLLPALLLPLLITFVSGWLQRRWALPAAWMSSLSAVFTGGAIAMLIWWVATLLDRVERESRESQRMRESAATDGLTGLANRRAFDQALAGLLHGRRQKDARFCLLMLDLDFFKTYNDSFGHLAGDDALRITARLLRDALRPDDLPARYGGEEFAVLLPGSDSEQALQIAARILELFRSEPWPCRPVTVSIGVAEAAHGDDAASLIARADAALYAAKHGGRDRAVLADAAFSPAG